MSEPRTIPTAVPLRAVQHLDNFWGIRAIEARTNPPTLKATAHGPQDEVRRFTAIRDGSGTFVQITEQDRDGNEEVFDPEQDPEIARWVIWAVDQQFPIRPRSVA